MKITQKKENMLMKKLGKKLAILAVIGAASIGFVGCGNSADNPEQTEETTTVENAETQENTEQTSQPNENGNNNENNTASDANNQSNPSNDNKIETKTNNNNSNSNSNNTSTPNKPTSNTSPTKPNNSSNNTSPSKPNNSNTSSSNTSTQKPTQQHVHNWTAQTKTINHPATGHNETYYVTVKEAYDEPIYAPRTICNKCGKDITGDPILHCAECRSSYSVNDVQVGTKHHDAVKEARTKWVVDKAAWTETVTTGYKCSSCGATK